MTVLILPALLFFTSSAAAGPFGPGATLVDDDGAQCSGAAYTSIQAAIDATPAGGVVGVCAGTYVEDVVVDKALTLRGARAGKDGRKRGIAGSGEARVVGAAPFTLDAEGVVLDGFTVIGQGAVAVRTGVGHSGYRIENNVIDAGGSVGLVPGTSAFDAMTVRRNHFVGGVAIASTNQAPEAYARELDVFDNLFTTSSLRFVSTEDNDVRIERNRVVGGGLLVDRAERVIVRRNTFVDAPGDAIVIDTTDDVEVADNNVRRAAGNGIVLVGPGNDATLQINRVSGCEVGIVVQAVGGAEILANESEDNGVGLVFTGSAGNLVRRNSIEDNVGAGIRVDATAVANTFEENEARGNGGLDCEDASAGQATAGTANTWTDNEGSEAAPAEICPD